MKPSAAASRCLDHTPTKWDNSFLEILYGYEWSDQEPGRRQPVEAQDGGGAHPGAVGPAGDPPVDADDRPVAAVDPIYAEITRRWLDHPEELARSTPRPGSSCCTATVRRATSVRWCPSRPGCGRTPFRPVKTLFDAAGRRDPQGGHRRVGSDRAAVGGHRMEGGGVVRSSDMRGGANGGRFGCSRSWAGRSTRPTNWPR